MGTVDKNQCNCRMLHDNIKSGSRMILGSIFKLDANKILVLLYNVMTSNCKPVVTKSTKRLIVIIHMVRSQMKPGGNSEFNERYSNEQ